MDDITHMSFYLENNAMRVFKKTIRTLGSPTYIGFRIHADGNSMILEPYEKKTFTSFKVPKNLYDDNGYMGVYSKGLCLLLANHLHWDSGKSYRIPGRMIPKQKIALFDLTKAVMIEKRQ